MRRKWKHRKEMEPFTPGQITGNKSKLIKSLIQLKGFQRALGSRWDACLEIQTSQEGPGDGCSHPAFSYSNMGAKYPKVTERRKHRSKRAHNFRGPASLRLKNSLCTGSEESCSPNQNGTQSAQSGKILLKNGKKGFVEPNVNSSSSFS